MSCSKVWQELGCRNWGAGTGVQELGCRNWGAGTGVQEHPGYKQNRLNGYFVLIFELELPYLEAVLQ
ncbi:MAG: hypothetical protein PHD76_04645 [Methylacidiphilales bacterium]|nr:hypothetical protein [Candidatus Methylacidiphilales bacterium]